MAIPSTASPDHLATGTGQTGRQAYPQPGSVLEKISETSHKVTRRDPFLVHAFLPMPLPLVLASASETRAGLLTRAGVTVEVVPARVDEPALQAALLQEGVTVRDMADALAEAKARRVASRMPDRLVLGCDQTAELDGALLTKPESPDAARAQVRALSGTRHALHSAAVLYEDNRPVWRIVETVRLHARPLSDTYIDDYVERNWERISGSVGAYRLEEEGARFFTRIEGDYFAVLGLPLLPLLSYLATRGVIDI